MITDEELTRWQALCDAATPGPWVIGKIRAGRIKSNGAHCSYLDCVESPLITQTATTHWHQGLKEFESWTHISTTDASHIRQGTTMVAGAFDYEPGGIATKSDAEFIALARTALPALIAEVRRLQQENEKEKKMIHKLLATRILQEGDANDRN